ncbi:MAG: hypothetical protein HUU55_20540 [Myxococcales bacterium]|nr:hypothetical protein [Myxococcales bacterium]
MKDNKPSSIDADGWLLRRMRPFGVIALISLLQVASTALLFVACGKDETTLTKFDSVAVTDTVEGVPEFGGGVPPFDAGFNSDIICEHSNCEDAGPPTPVPQCNQDSECSGFVSQLPQCTAVQCASDGVCEVGDDPSLACDPFALPDPPGLLCKLSGDKDETVVCPVRVVRKHSEVDGPVSLTFDLHYPGLLVHIGSAWVTPCDPPNSCTPVLVPPATLHPHGHVFTPSPNPWDLWAGDGSITIVPPAGQPGVSLTDAYLNNLGGVVGNDIVFEVEFKLNARLAVPVAVILSNIVAKTPSGQLLPTTVTDERIVVGAEQPIDPCDDPADCPVVVPPGTICQVGGIAGETVFCPIGLIRAGAASAFPSSLDFTLHYDNTILNFQGFQAYPCADWNCEPQDVPPSAMPLTGHDVELTPTNPTEWAGSGTIGVFNTDELPKILSDAYLVSGQPVGSPHFIEAVFQLTTAKTDIDPAFIGISDVTVLGGENKTLSVSLLDNWIVVDGPQQCPWAETCNEPPDPPDVPPGAICAVSGAVGTTVDCGLHLARKSSSSQLATALQGVLEYDPQAVKLDNFYDTNCYPGIGCFEVPCAGSQAKALSSGHSMSTAPLTPSSWNGSVGIVIANISDPTIPLTTATLMADGTTVQGDSLFVLARFIVQKPLSPQQPAAITIIKTLGSSAGAVTLPANIQNQIIVTQ